MKELDAVRHAAGNLVAVAKSLHVPLDTSYFEKTLSDLEKAVGSSRGPVVNKPVDK